MRSKKLVYGVGLNDADYRVSLKEELPKVDGKRKQRVVWTCPFYKTWQEMLRRCYSESFQAKHPTYVGCTVSAAWLTFSNFRKWMDAQEWEGNYLDKDLLVPGNRVYSSETCLFVTRLVNNFLTDNAVNRGDYPVGVHFDKKAGKFVAQCHRLAVGEKHLGYFATPEEAHKVYVEYKIELAKELADMQTDHKVKDAILNRIAQGMVIPVKQVQFEEVDELKSTKRGDKGFGSTGR